jgi:hypothetical protein
MRIKAFYCFTSHDLDLRSKKRMDLEIVVARGFFFLMFSPLHEESHMLL